MAAGMLAAQRPSLPRSSHEDAPLWAALAAALIVLACGAPAASADSIAYIKDGNVWLSDPRRRAPVPGDHAPAATPTSRRPTTAR